MRVAIIGSGVAGLGAAHLLARVHEVELFEREARAGGHANTVVQDGLSLDTGFLVYNERNYLLLCRLFRELGVPTQESEMSFSVSCAGCGLEYPGRRPFAQPRNAASPRFQTLLWEIGRWLRTARRSLDEGDYEERTLAGYLDERGYSRRFREHFLVPLTSAARGLRLGLGVRSLRRREDEVELRTEDGELRRFDAVVVATHADQTLALLEDASADERRVLGGFEYTVNDTVLHTDPSFLPRTRAARASWNYRTGDGDRPTLTYYLNRLQRLESERDFCVTLNQTVADEHVLARFAYAHPLFSVASLRAQAELPRLAGGRTFFAGAYFGNGFHEDGLASGVAAAAALGVEWLGDLHRDAPARPPHAGAERVPLSDLVLALRPRRAARARAAAAPLLRRPAQPRHAPRRRPLRRRPAAEAGRSRERWKPRSSGQSDSVMRSGKDL